MAVICEKCWSVCRAGVGLHVNRSGGTRKRYCLREGRSKRAVMPRQKINLSAPMKRCAKLSRQRVVRQELGTIPSKAAPDIVNHTMPPRSRAPCTRRSVKAITDAVELFE